MRRLETSIAATLTAMAPCRFKIGITHHPVWRYWQYWKRGSTRLFVLLQSDSPDAVDWAEAHCIDYGRRIAAQQHNIITGNWVRDRGGEGTMSTFAPPYFMYLVLFNDWTLRYESERAPAAARAPKWWQELPRLPP